MQGRANPTIDPLPKPFWDDLKDIALEASKQSPMGTLIVFCVFGLLLAGMILNGFLKYMIFRDQNGNDYRNKKLQAQYRLERYKAKLNQQGNKPPKTDKDSRGK